MITVVPRDVYPGPSVAAQVTYLTFLVTNLSDKISWLLIINLEKNIDSHNSLFYRYMIELFSYAVSLYEVFCTNKNETLRLHKSIHLY